MKTKLLTCCLSALLGTQLGIQIGTAKTAQEYNAQAIADLFYKLNGDKNPHKKINHTKGFCANANFLPKKGIDKILHIPMLQQHSIPTLVRYSLSGGNPNASDKSKVRGMALKIQGNQEIWEIVMTNTEINFAKNPQEFYEYFSRMLPSTQESTRQAINNKPFAKNYHSYLETLGITKSVANTPFYSVHTFWFKNKKGQEVAARFKFVPREGVAYLTEEEIKQYSDDFLRSDFLAKIKETPIIYDMYLVYANKGDKTDDTTALWEGKHKEVLVGSLEVTQDQGTACNSDVFMPSNLPQGVSEPKDELFTLRNEVYGITFGRRQ